MTRYKGILVIMALALSAFSAPSVSDKAAKKRVEIRQMRTETLAALYKEEPKARSEIEESVGYAVFSNVGVNVVFLSGGGGKGVVYDKSTNTDTFMKMGTAGIGLGLGVKDFRAIFIFSRQEALDKFIDKGWDFSGQADAAANSGEKGGEASGASTVLSGVKVYQITEGGLALQATLQGTKYWKDKKLNKKKK